MKNVELNRDVIEKIKAETPDLIREFIQSDLVKMILYGSCARGDFETGLTPGNIMIKLMKRQQNSH